MIKEKVYFWPHWFLESLINKSGKPTQISQQTLSSLGKANIYLWRALNIYDDFLDGAGKAQQLPVANSYYRRCLKIYYQLALSKNFYRLLDQLFKNIDKSNKAEINIRKNWGQLEPNRATFLKIISQTPSSLSDKSLALALAPLAIADLNHSKNKIQEINNILDFFRHALAAKQLSDDARDWLDDLRNGHITIANVLVLKEALDRGITLNLEKKPEIAYCLFAGRPSLTVSKMLKSLCLKTRIKNKKAGLKTDSQLLTEIIGPIEKGLKDSQNFRRLWKKNNK